VLLCSVRLAAAVGLGVPIISYSVATFVPNGIARADMLGPRVARVGQKVPGLLGSSDRLEEQHGQLTSTRGGEWVARGGE
jgi:hypothetical protein